MSSKSKSAATNDELDKLFEGIGEEDKTPSAPPNTSAGKRPKSSGQSTKQSEQDLLAELDNLAAQRPASRPQTPRQPSTTSAPKRPSTEAPAQATSNRDSEDKLSLQHPPRKSGESTRSYHTSTTPAPQAPVEPEERATAANPTEHTQQAQQAQQGGGWWGGIFATASAAVKQAEAAVKEIQKNEEAQRWAEQVKGNVGALRGLGKSHICTTKPIPKAI